MKCDWGHSSILLKFIYDLLVTTCFLLSEVDLSEKYAKILLLLMGASLLVDDILPVSMAAIQVFVCGQISALESISL